MPDKYIYDFEQSLLDIQNRIDELQLTSTKTGVDVTLKINDLREELKQKAIDIYTNLDRWQKVQIARHPDRPHAIDYINLITSYWFELHGDRNYADDKSILSGLATIDDHKVVIIAQEKGRGTKDKLFRNFGMPKPEGYRKALRIMKLAEKYDLPIITLIDTPGAYPGIGAEQRGQAGAIASSIECCMSLKVPIISIIVGEGGSGGAIALASANKVLMLENAIYSVISPEGCASILWRDPSKALEAAKAMKLTANELLKMKIIDEIIKEPIGGAHRNRDQILVSIETSLTNSLDEFKDYTREEIYEQRKQKFLNIGTQGTFKIFSSKNILANKNNLFASFREILSKFKKEVIIIALLILGAFLFLF